MLREELAAYARGYQAARAGRCDEHDGLFLPLELLTDRTTGEQHLSVSFSASSSTDLYITQAASLIRAVKVVRRWLVVPWTVAKLFSKAEFAERFAALLEEEDVEGERFWVFRNSFLPQAAAIIDSLQLDESFREEFEHEYLPEPDPPG